MITFAQYVFNENTQITDALILKIASFVTHKVKYILQNKVAYANFNTELIKTWNLYYILPDKEKIKFEFSPSKNNAGSYRLENNEHVINIGIDSLYQGDLYSI